MNKIVLAALNDAERQLVGETERQALDRLDEDCTCASDQRGTSTSASTAALRAPG